MYLVLIRYIYCFITILCLVYISNRVVKLLRYWFLYIYISYFLDFIVLVGYKVYWNILEGKYFCNLKM